MKRECLSCRSDDFVTVKGNLSATGIGDNIPLNPGVAVVRKRICLKCGHIDYYVDHENLLKIQKKYGG
ncbi:MAG: hypothetical protein GX972_09140 [Amphibacillus sp.]|nr:hypothetical protein [Amphibacillus sp.]